MLNVKRSELHSADQKQKEINEKDKRESCL